MRPADPVTLVSGCGGTGAEWRALIGLLGRPHTVVERPCVRRPTLAAAVQQLDSEAPPSSILVAHSMGAFHAEAFARTSPERVRGLVLLDPSIEPTPRGSLLPSAAAEGIADLLRAVRAGRRASLLVTEWLAYQDQAEELAQSRATSSITCPTVILTARPHPGARQRAALQREWGTPLEWQRVARSGHMVMKDRPDAVLRAIEGLAQRQGSAQADAGDLGLGDG